MNCFERYFSSKEAVVYIKFSNICAEHAIKIKQDIIEL